jgi:SPP1 gp7 family putative phage head morphogenesis protein
MTALLATTAPGTYRCYAKVLGDKALVTIWLKAHAAAERAMAADVQAVFAVAAEQVGDRLRTIKVAGRDPSDLADQLFGPEAWTATLKAGLRGVLLRTALAGARAEWELRRPRTAKEIHRLFLVRKDDTAAPTDRTTSSYTRDELEALRVKLPPDVRSRIDKWLDDLLDRPYWDDVADTTRRGIVEDLRAGLDAGESGDKIAERIEETLGPDGSKARAENIARTETTGAMLAGSLESMNKLSEMGLVSGREWLAIDDASTREDHAEANGQIVAMDEPFLVGGEEGMYPGDPDFSAAQRCRCRCTMLSRAPDEMPDAKESTEEKAFRLRVKAASATSDEPATLIDVPDIKQWNAFACGAAVARAVATYFDAADAIDDTDKAWEEACGTTKSDGTEPSGIVTALKRCGLQVIAAEMAVADLADYFRRGWPVICAVQAWGTEAQEAAGRSGHYVTVIGVGLGMVFVVDPANDPVAGRRIIVEADFLDSWHDTGVNGEEFNQYGIAVGPPAGQEKAYSLWWKEGGACRVSAGSSEGGQFTSCSTEAGGKAEVKEQATARKLANKKIKDAPVPTEEQVEKARAEMQLAREGKARAGGESRGGSAASRRQQRRNLFAEFGGDKRGYVVCPWTGKKMHWTDDAKENPNGYPKFERGKIFVKCQGGGYQLHNLIPESFEANRSRNDKRLRKENSHGC